MTDPPAIPKNRSWYLVRRLLPYAWRRRGPLALVGFGMFLDIGFTLLQPWPLKVLVDNVLDGRPVHGFLFSLFHALPGPHTRDALLTWTIAATVLIVLLNLVLIGQLLV